MAEEEKTEETPVKEESKQKFLKNSKAL